ncbi:MAG: glycoside hydrolase family 3 N-terminal domain-containing protein [Beijerinckiaceae bacterium]|nr:glycoside hydrolase family 3 N-terminal domain-containing protein [Beijerinckiaceae bacterium]
MSLTRRGLFVGAGSLMAAPYVTRASAAASDDMIGDMLVLGFSGAAPDSESARGVARHIAAGRAAGACFLGHNTRSKAGVEGLTRLFAGAGRRRAPLIAVDQEGGAVQRLGPKIGYPRIPTAAEIASKYDPAKAKEIYGDMAATLRDAGFNLNLAPVVDLGFQPKNPIVAKFGRAYGNDGKTVARYAAAFVAGHRQHQVLTALKHFPGHGSTLVDSHARPVDLGPTWRDDELTPYRDLIRQNLVDLVMSGHLSHPGLTGGEPATLSELAVEGLLRRRLGFRGIVMTDDLDMAAIRSTVPLLDACVRAVAAGNDLLLLSNSASPDPDLPQKVIAVVKTAVAEGRIPRGRIEASASRLASLSVAKMPS